MSLLRSLQLKKNQLMIFAILFIGLVFLVYHTYFVGTWHCWDKTKDKRFEIRGSYVVLYNYVTSSRDMGCRDSVTLCTHADITSLRDIRQTARRWNGPISIAVYCPGDDFYAALKIIAYLRKCSHDNIRKYITFHIVFDVDFYPTTNVEGLYNLYKDNMDCTEYPLRPNTTIIHKSKNLLYPVNILRNTAREASQTYFVLSTDIKLTPTWDLAKKFMRMADRFYDSISRNYHPAVFVLPAFEVDEFTPVPMNRTFLSETLIRGNGRVYQSDRCPKCQVVPNMSYKKWMAKSNGEGLGFQYTTKYSDGWQPFFIGTQSDPAFDERCFWLGTTNRMSQVYTMCYQKYTFLVLDNGFLVYVKEKPKNLTLWIDHHREQVYKTQLTTDFKTIFGEHECFDLF